MKQLEDMVLDIVWDFVKNEVLFTALDVSNKVKETMPLVRHREVRDEVRKLFTLEMQHHVGYAHTPIKVNLEDGSMAEAMLYHPLVDSWDLDYKYNMQQRQAVSSRPTMPVISSVPQVPVVPAVVQASVAQTVAAQPTTAQALSNRAKWDQLFGTQPSLFPRR